MIGDDIRIKVLGIKGNLVRLGITAPKQITVHRDEVYDRIQQEAKVRQSVARARPLSATSVT